MVKNIVNAIVEQMEKENLLNIEMKEYFTYSIAMIIEKWITIISVLFVGGIFKQFVQMMLFLFFFLLLRKRTGGYHASSFHITRTTASASTTYEKRTGSISVDSTYSYVNTYTLATGSSTKSKGYYTSVEINFSAPYNCHSVRIRSSHKVSAYGQTWSSNSTAVY